MKFTPVISTLLVLSWSLFALSNLDSKPAENPKFPVPSSVYLETLQDEKQIDFDRFSLTKYRETFYEGYWSQSREDKERKFPFPKEHELPFEGKESFIKKLRAIEASDLVRTIYTRGFSSCRLGDKHFNGSTEYSLEFEDRKVNWPEGYLHYVEKHNVVPSREFYRLITNLYKLFFEI